MEPVADKYGITAEWLTDALRAEGHLPEGRVSAVDIGDVGVGRGYISQTVRVTPSTRGQTGMRPRASWRRFRRSWKCPST